ncbi:unnamed protein product [Echinostoma caproni]|uniref:Phosphotriesterase-related protein n=1 Tax=Echinostoma caproni TaxID=27848 RepID=A0A183AFN6_9TREM|nr:unnamed protein product [Echinostoma caproni]
MSAKVASGVLAIGKAKRRFFSFPHITKKDLLIYGTYIRPVPEYGIQVVQSGLIRDRATLEGVQRAATKAVIGMKHLPFPKRLVAPDLHPLNLGITPDCCVSPFTSRLGWLGPVKDLGSTPTKDNLAPTMVVWHGYLHRFGYMRPDQVENHIPCLTPKVF